MAAGQLVEKGMHQVSEETVSHTLPCLVWAAATILLRMLSYCDERVLALGGAGWLALACESKARATGERETFGWSGTCVSPR